MECSTDLIRSYAAGEQIDPSLVDRLRQHLDSCPTCRALLQQERALTAGLVQLPRIQVPPEFSFQILRRIRALAQGAFAERRESRRVWASAAGMLLLGALCIFLDQAFGDSDAAALDEFILQGFALVADIVVFGMTAAVFTSQAALQVLLMLSGILLSLGRWSLTLPPLWLGLGFSLFALSHGMLYWILRHQHGTAEDSGQLPATGGR